ncbi:MAG: site-specific integrase [Planctomycetota bacterium]|nr:site-specific integrase [Planctomycetota bacterium]
MSEQRILLQVQVLVGSIEGQSTVRAVTMPLADGQVLATQSVLPAPEKKPPGPSPIHQLFDEYMAWGRVQGGKGKRAWSVDHETHVRGRLEWWIERLGVYQLEDVTLRQVEEAVQSLRGRTKRGETKPASGKTKKDYLFSLLAFRRWAADRDLIRIPDKDPLRALEIPDHQPERPYRALTADEYRRLLNAASPFRAEIYEALTLSGLRSGELRRVRASMLDKAHQRIILPPRSTKNRKVAMVPIPSVLWGKLLERARSKEPDEPLYTYNRQSLSQEFIRDLAVAGIPRDTAEGRASVHGLRDTAATILQQQLGADVATAQRFLRHSSPGITLERYTSVSQDRQAQMVEDLARHLCGS